MRLTSFQDMDIGQRGFFSPVQIPNCALWLDAADASTITQVAGSVSQWNDKSGNVNNATQGTGANQPVTGSLTINSLNAMYFQSANSRFMTLTSRISRTGGYTIFSPLTVGNSGATTALTGMSGSGTAGFSLSFNTTLNPRIVKAGVSVPLVGTNPLSASTPAIVSAITSFGASPQNALYTNGVANGSNTTDPAYTADFNSIGNTASTQYLDARVGEIIVYTRILSVQEHDLIGSYLAAKWGMSWTNL